MDGVSIKKLARDMSMSIDQLILQLSEIGVSVSSPEDPISGTDQLRLLQHMRASDDKDEPGKGVSLDDIEAATELTALNQLLTRSMSDRKIQALIKDDNLNSVTEKVLDLNLESDEHELQTAAVLGRLAAVARGREEMVFDRANDIFSDEPVPIESLDDGESKAYAATIIAHCNDGWVKDYSYRNAFDIDTADIARRELLDARLSRENSLSAWLAAMSGQAGVIRGITKDETRYRRIRRVAGVIADISERWRGRVGEDIGTTLSQFLKVLFVRGWDKVEFPIVVDTMDSLLAVLRRSIELRFSTALYADLYAILLEGKRILGAGYWDRYLDQSEALPAIRHALLEASLVLARQDKFDKDMMSVLRTAYGSRAQMTHALEARFSDAKDLDPTMANWWVKGGGGEGDKEQKAQRIRNSEDEKIGELLLQVEESQSVMEKLRSAVLPILQSLNPVLAKTVEKAATDYRETARVIRSLSRMRQLKPAGLMSERIEYNRRLHDMEGGHTSGVRHVRVIRDGVEKSFAGKTKMIVKPIVTAEE